MSQVLVGCSKSSRSPRAGRRVNRYIVEITGIVPFILRLSTYDKKFFSNLSIFNFLRINFTRFGAVRGTNHSVPFHLLDHPRCAIVSYP